MGSHYSSDEEERYRDELIDEGMENDWLAGAAYGLAARPAPPQAPLAVAAAGPSSDKGKGKAVEGSEEAEKPAEAIEELTPERKRNREELSKLSAVDDFTVSSLVRNDPTPISSMPTHTKIVQSLRLLHEVFEHARPQPARYTEFDAARAPEPFSTTAYAQLLELLGSALSDVTANPLAFDPRALGTAGLKKTVYELQLERARLSMDPSRPWTTPPTSSNGWGAIPNNEPMSRKEKEDLDLADLFADNARIALLILRPRIFPDEELTATDPSAPLEASISSPPTAIKEPSTSPPISTLPSELLSYILLLARSLSEERHPLAGVGYSESGYDEQGYPISGIMPRRRGIPGLGQLEGSRTAGQRFALNLALVCREWRAPARRVAFRSLHCRKTRQMQKLLELFETEPEAVDLEWIQQINAKVLKTPDMGAAGLGVVRSRGYSRYVGGGASWASGGQVGVGSSSAALEKSEESSAAAVFAKLVSKVPRLRSASLNIVGNPYSVGFGGRPVVAEFLEPPILTALSSLPTLSYLALDFTIDFEELELIVNGLPSLETLNLLAVDSINGSGTVASPNAHPATNLRSFTLGDSAQFRDLTLMTDVQLAWLLEPSANAGRLQEVDITVMSQNGGGWGPLGNIQANQPPPFASQLVADLLERNAGNLKRLALRDLAALGGGGTYPSFANVPHNGNFDHLLNLCTSLEELVIQFVYTDNLLDSLQHSHLTSLFLLGTPRPQTRAEDFAARLEEPEGQFKKLERLVVSGQWFGRGGNQGGFGGGPAVVPGGGWSGSAVRRIKAVCRERVPRIACSFNSAQ